MLISQFIPQLSHCAIIKHVTHNVAKEFINTYIYTT